MKFFITGGAGFIGSALIRFLINETNHEVLNFDKLTYAGSLDNLKEIESSSRYTFVKGDICDKSFLRQVLLDFKPDKIMHLAAESHVDRSIDAPADFIQTNIIGTFNLLQNAVELVQKYNNEHFLFHHISTDEVYGELEETGYFTEETPYDPSSPYSASKASSDHLVRAWGRTYQFPFVITNCSNNYGPYQNFEKLIPNVIKCALNGKPIPVYGKGNNIRDWLYVEDHAKALYEVVMNAKKYKTYNIGGECEVKNIDLVKLICKSLDKIYSTSSQVPHEKLITFVEDRKGHDFRYAIDCSKIKSELNWRPSTLLEDGLLRTIEWYIKKLKL